MGPRATCFSLVAAALLCAGCSSARTAAPESNGTAHDSGPVADDVGTPPSCALGAACAEADGRKGLCRSDGSCGCTDGADDDQCDASYGEDPAHFACTHGACSLVYPSGPYGLKIGQVFPDVHVDGYPNGDDLDPSSWTSWSMLDLYDPLGERGITGIYVAVIHPNCSPTEVDALAKWWTIDFRSRGARFLAIAYEASAWKPAT